ncbi:hypothetical protein HNY73_007337 [Argiope bruennichi]|uniref:Uncharacterized protein n=1 Tax=Argiope bruennichi TaxID=94029 RepID=A0A8T0FDM8_ARGBR|nr:hypothetical protein HNY73_007337 [Argiope bruennichi]
MHLIYVGAPYLLGYDVVMHLTKGLFLLILSPLWPAGSVRTACSMSPYATPPPTPADGSSVPTRRRSEANGRKETLGAREEEQRCLVYIDETWVNGNLKYGKCWQDDFTEGSRTNTSSKNRLTVIHAGIEDGFIDGAKLVYKASSSSGDYHGQMNGDLFKKWIVDKRLPNLKPNSVIYMDNATYHFVKKRIAFRQNIQPKERCLNS